MRTVRVFGIGLSWMAGNAAVAGVRQSYAGREDERFMAGANYPVRLMEVARQQLGINLEFLNRAKGETCICDPARSGSITANTSWHSNGNLRAPALAVAEAAGCDRLEILIGGQDGVFNMTNANYQTDFADLLDELLALSWLKKIVYHTGPCAGDAVLGTYPPQTPLDGTSIWEAWDTICTTYTASNPTQFFRGVDLYTAMVTKGTASPGQGPLLDDNAHCSIEGLGWMARQILRHNASIGFYG